MVAQKKQLQVEQLVESLEKNPNFALVSFGPTPHTSLEKLRKELKKINSNFKVVKNAIFERALNRISNTNKNLKPLTQDSFPLRESSAVLTLGDDYITGLSTFYKQSKTETGLIFKFGFLEDKFYIADDLTKLAQLPPKEQLLAKLIGSLKSPMAKLVYAMKFNTTKLAYVLQQRSQKSN